MGCSEDACGWAHEFYKNYDQLSYALKIALAKRYGFKRRGKLSATSVASTILSLRQAALEEVNRNRSQPAARGDPNPGADPARRVGKSSEAPSVLKAIDYVDKEDELRQALPGSGPEFGVSMPQAELPSNEERPMEGEPEGPDPNLSLTRTLMDSLAHHPDLKFLRGHSPHLSAFVSARVTHDLRNGESDTHSSIQNALTCAAEQGGFLPFGKKRV